MVKSPKHDIDAFRGSGGSPYDVADKFFPERWASPRRWYPRALSGIPLRIAPRNGRRQNDVFFLLERDRVVTYTILTPLLFMSVRLPPRTRTFLASERPTIADIALVCASRDVFETPLGMMGPKDLAAIPHVLRWYRTMTHLPAVVAVWPLEAKGDSVPPAPEKPSKKGKGAPAGAGAGAGAPAASTARSLGTSAPSNKAASCATGSGAAGGVPLEEAVPVLGASGDVKTTASVVQGARKLDLVPAKFKRKRIRVKELLSSGKTLVGQKAVVKGWLRTARSASKGALLFLVLDDGSCPGTAQVMQLFFVRRISGCVLDGTELAPVRLAPRECIFDESCQNELLGYKMFPFFLSNIGPFMHIFT